MGTGDNDLGKKKASRGTTDTARSLETLQRKGGNKGKLNWDEADPKNLAALITIAVECGGAVSFSRSRDGGAISLTVYLDGTKKTLWYNQDANLDDELEIVIAFFNTMV